MQTLRKSNERGYADHGWLKSFHTFSFGSYHDSAHMGVGNLRVINEDRVAPGQGFGTHGHRDMEIVSYVLAGALAHADSMGHGELGSGKGGGVIRPGDVQRMSAGTGVLHSEFNPDPEREVHFLQIWILPKGNGIAPSYEQKHFDAAAKRGRLCPIAAPVDSALNRDGAVGLHADATIYAALVDGDEHIEHTLDPTRITYVHLARGQLTVNGTVLSAGDALRLDQERVLRLDQGRNAEVLVFALAV